ncbi:unnamed protein product [Cyprideis torosa]|uniref:Uncharacterized protein n=1 Tax=Cyprideis torosa TaxID=163714 RepID=A0A7R8WQT9_9CRUS|nr:unnamed protein product [Cyprideis torosa]CAG0902858.1 unnamed protein product [Cyprideis torosa]
MFHFQEFFLQIIGDEVFFDAERIPRGHKASAWLWGLVACDNASSTVCSEPRRKETRKRNDGVTGPLPCPGDRPSLVDRPSPADGLPLVRGLMDIATILQRTTVLTEIRLPNIKRKGLRSGEEGICREKRLVTPTASLNRPGKRVDLHHATCEAHPAKKARRTWNRVCMIFWTMTASVEYARRAAAHAAWPPPVLYAVAKRPIADMSFSIAWLTLALITAELSTF